MDFVQKTGPKAAAVSAASSDVTTSTSTKESLSTLTSMYSVTAEVEPQPSKGGGSCNMTTATPAVSTHTPVVPRSSVLRFPVRIGITWKKGERLEAQDFSNTWYPSKIVEISEEEKAVLIHFEGWNQRYDEWVDMASERLRPTTRHSERKDKGINKRRRVHPHPIYRPGDEVLARWKDCKKYPAKISRLVEESTYEVIFYDGVTHLIQAMNIQPLPEEIKAMKAKNVPPPPKAKLSFKQVKVNLPASIRKKQEQKQERSGQTFSGKILVKSKRSPSKLIAKSKLLPKVTLKRDRELDVFSVTGSRNTPTPTKNVLKEPTPVTITCEATLSTLSEAECLKLFGSAAVSRGGASIESSNQPSSSVEGLSVGSINTPKEINSGHSSTLDAVPKVLSKPGKESRGGKKRPGSRVRKRANTDTGAGIKKRKLVTVGAESGVASDLKAVKKPQGPVLGSGERSKSLDLPGYLGTPLPLAPLLPQIFVPSKAFIVEEDHNPFKCPHEGCTKDFRKESLLQYHIKYYHTEPEVSTSPSAMSHPTQPSAAASGVLPIEATCSLTVGTSGSTGNSGKHKTDGANSSTVQTPPALSSVSLTPSVGTPKRRRRKTDSICSTDSEMSASSKSKSSKRHRNDSEISVTTESPEVAGRESQTDSSRLVQELKAEEEPLVWPDTEEADEEEMASDMVNCVCGERHHTGLMIQCEVCLCWQHFKCADVKKTGVPPLNYVCLICENSPGTRDSCKYLHDMGWERRGELPSFPFVQQQASGGSKSSRISNTAHLTTLASECNDLLTSLHGIKHALHSTRRQIKISKEEDDPEFQLWQTDWDNWIKPQEDLALTPRSGDPELSPTPSTFLFSPATSVHCKEEKEEDRLEGQKSSQVWASKISPTSTQAITKVSVSSLSTAATPESSTIMSCSQSSSLPSPSLLLSPTTGRLVSACESHLASKPVMQAFSSQLFSVSSTPPKASTATFAAGTTTTCVASPNSTVAVPTPRDTVQVPSSEFLASVGERVTGPAADNPLAINTAQVLSVNTGAACAPSPSSSSLSSLQMSTPPMLLSPSNEPPPHTPSVGRASSILPSIMNQADMGSLVRDLFPGPAGDAPAQDLNKRSDHLSEINRAAFGPQSIKKDPSLCGEDSSVSADIKIETPSSGVLENQKFQELARILEEQGEKVSEGVEDKDLFSDAGLISSFKASGSENSLTFTPHDDPTSVKLEQTSEQAQDANPDVTQKLPSSSSFRFHHHADLWNTEVKQENGSLSPNHVSSFYVGVNGMAESHTSFSNEDDEDTQDNDTDTAEESADPYKNCEHNLLVHVQQVHTDIERQLDGLEARMAELENSEHNNPTIQLSEENILNDVPALKKSLSKLARYLLKVQHFTS
ncbi:hypothetical protein RRG08_058125 [Elysia crispata]|uniref:C2H2-type domain-containing protein n=1 Tax=Elysia crispata TaxID=231223 RepID=A0AAE1AED7_9GAST|nr:hypothetical protein RRG08_058125 [Elysia crispata]